MPEPSFTAVVLVSKPIVSTLSTKLTSESNVTAAPSLPIAAVVLFAPLVKPVKVTSIESLLGNGLVVLLAVHPVYVTCSLPINKVPV